MDHLFKTAELYLGMKGTVSFNDANCCQYAAIFFYTVIWAFNGVINNLYNQDQVGHDVSVKKRWIAWNKHNK